MTSHNQLVKFVSLREKLAELEHRQWIYWSKDVVQKEKLTKERLERWRLLWKPYSQLTEKEKKKDRIWADKVLQLIKKGGKRFSYD